MSTQQALVLRDVEGSYYVIPPAVLEANRVPAEQEAPGEDVAGYIAYLPNPGGAPSLPSYGYSYSYGPSGYSYAYWYTVPSLPSPGPRVTPLGPVVPN